MHDLADALNRLGLGRVTDVNQRAVNHSLLDALASFPSPRIRQTFICFHFHHRPSPHPYPPRIALRPAVRAAWSTAANSTSHPLIQHTATASFNRNTRGSQPRLPCLLVIINVIALVAANIARIRRRSRPFHLLLRVHQLHVVILLLYLRTRQKLPSSPSRASHRLACPPPPSNSSN